MYTTDDIPAELSISIHAPAKGATWGNEVESEIEIYFNPRSREGSDVVLTYFPKDNMHFNPRSREGSDPPR